VFKRNWQTLCAFTPLHEIAFCLTMISIVFSFLILMFPAHPIHVSVTEITLDEKERELEIIARLFVDDVETSIQKMNDQPELKLLGPSTDQLVWKYLESRFRISLDGRAQKIKYLGHEIEGEAILCYIQVSNIKKWKEIEVMNSVITELYDDQSNLVHVTVRDKVKSLRLMRDNPSGKLTFDVK
jgi:hypothetical protein